jgi:hypothetical protein
MFKSFRNVGRPGDGEDWGKEHGFVDARCGPGLSIRRV